MGNVWFRQLIVGILGMAWSCAVSAPAVGFAGPWYIDPVESQDIRQVIYKEWKYLDETQIKWIQTSKGAYPTGIKWMRLTEPQIDWVVKTASIVPFGPIEQIDLASSFVGILYKDTARVIHFEAGFNLQSTTDQSRQFIELVELGPKYMVIETYSTDNGTAQQDFRLIDRDGEQVMIVDTVIDHPALPHSIRLHQEYLRYPRTDIQWIKFRKPKERMTTY